MNDVLIGMCIGVPLGLLGTLAIAVVVGATRRRVPGVLELDTPEARRAVGKPW